MPATPEYEICSIFPLDPGIYFSQKRLLAIRLRQKGDRVKFFTRSAGLFSGNTFTERSSTFFKNRSDRKRESDTGYRTEEK
jgi:hypothetical protein